VGGGGEVEARQETECLEEDERDGEWECAREGARGRPSMGAREKER